MDYLEQAKIHAGQVLQVTGGTDWAQLEAQLAIAHAAIALTETMDRAANALIAIAERMDKAAEDAELEAERKELTQARVNRYMAERKG